MKTGKIYLIPCPLGTDDPIKSLPLHTLEIINSLNYFVVENAKTARHFIKNCNHPIAIQELNFDILDKKTDQLFIPELISPCLKGNNIGIISEAGCPGVADPGSALINYAHLKKIQVVPLIGPSSILLALMAAGFNGQSFAFHGYLPKGIDDLKKKLKSFEKHIKDYRQTQIFIETPYRTNQIINSVSNLLANDIKLCVAANINQQNESIATKTISKWKTSNFNYGKSPAVFLLFS